MPQNINSKHQKVGGKSTGTNYDFKRDGYARGPVPKSMVGTKVGLTNHQGYSARTWPRVRTTDK